MNIIGIYPVSTQPPHLGHFRAYEFLKKVTGVNTFVATSDVVNLPKSPLNFQEKQQIWTRHGVPIDKIVLDNNPLQAGEITKKFGRDRVIAIFGMSQTDANDVLRKPNSGFVKYPGTLNNLKPMSEVSYILVIPDTVLTVNKSINNDTFRRAFSSKTLSEEKKKSFFKQTFGWYDISLFDLIKKKFAEANMVKERINENESLVFRRTLKPFVEEVLTELLSNPTQPSPTTSVATTTTSTLPDTMSPADAAKAARLEKDVKRKELQTLQKQLDLKKKKKENDKKQGELDVKNLDAQVKAAKKQI